MKKLKLDLSKLREERFAAESQPGLGTVVAHREADTLINNCHDPTALRPGARPLCRTRRQRRASRGPLTPGPSPANCAGEG